MRSTDKLQLLRFDDTMVNAIRSGKSHVLDQEFAADLASSYTDFLGTIYAWCYGPSKSHILSSQPASREKSPGKTLATNLSFMAGQYTRLITAFPIHQERQTMGESISRAAKHDGNVFACSFAGSVR